MNIKIGKNEYELKPLDHRLLLNIGEVPFSFFSVKRGKTIYQQMIDQKKSDSSGGEQELKILQYVLKNGVLSINKEPFDVDLYLEQKGNDILEAYAAMGQIFNMTFKLFNSHTEMKIDDVVAIDVLAKRYGQTPIDIAFPGLEYTPWDAFIFNTFIAGNAIEREVERQKQEIGAYKR